MKLMLRCLGCLVSLPISIFLIVDGIIRIFVIDVIGIKMRINGIVLIIFGLVLLINGIILISMILFDFKIIKQIGYRNYLEAVKDRPIINTIFPFKKKRK